MEAKNNIMNFQVLQKQKEKKKKEITNPECLPQWNKNIFQNEVQVHLQKNKDEICDQPTHKKWNAKGNFLDRKVIPDRSILI